jgi:thiamine biosynthesis lipoprotein ApbE
MAAYPTDLAKNLLRASAWGLTAWSGGKNYVPAVVQPFAEERPPQRQFSQGAFLGEYDNILGTSMELRLQTAHPAEAQETEWQVLGEIERLRGILSTYDPASEIRRVMAGAPVVSPEISELLGLYAQWTERTAGAIKVNMGEVNRLWKTAETTGQAPTKAAMHRASTLPHAYNVDALGKGFIIDRAVQVARQFAPSGLLNIGGDIRVWGREAWLIGVAHPLETAENVAPLAQFLLQEAAVTTSGGYARYFTVNGKKYSHIIDPRSQQPASPWASATVVAKDCVTANALSTAACVLGAKLGEEMIARWGGLEHFIIDAVGKVQHTGAFTAVETPTAPQTAPTTTKPAPATTTDKPAADKTPAPDVWPKDFQVTVDITLKGPQNANRGFRRPYVAIWIEDADKKVVRTISVWGTNERYQSTLSRWWRATPTTNYNAITAVTRATRPAGEYSVVWDGRDDHRKLVPKGDYTIYFEINREHGTHATESAVLHCADESKTGEIRATTESEVTKLVYGPNHSNAAGPTAANPSTTSPSISK